jgi:hypothetical protein
MDNETWPENNDCYDDSQEFRFEFERNLQEFKNG